MKRDISLLERCCSTWRIRHISFGKRVGNNIDVQKTDTSGCIDTLMFRDKFRHNIASSVLDIRKLSNEGGANLEIPTSQINNDERSVKVRRVISEQLSHYFHIRFSCRTARPYAGKIL